MTITHGSDERSVRGAERAVTAENSRIRRHDGTFGGRPAQPYDISDIACAISSALTSRIG